MGRLSIHRVSATKGGSSADGSRRKSLIMSCVVFIKAAAADD
jgi:hypothetical protein